MDLSVYGSAGACSGMMYLYVCRLSTYEVDCLLTFQTCHTPLRDTKFLHDATSHGSIYQRLVSM